MKKFLAFFFLLLLSSNIVLAQDNGKISLKMSFPDTSRTLELNGRPFYFTGVVTPANSHVTVNGTEASVDQDGAFLAYAPVILLSPKDSLGYSKAEIEVRITSGNESKTINKTYLAKLPLRTSSMDSLSVDRDWINTPSDSIWVEMGESVNVKLKATPGCKGYFTVGDGLEKFPLEETRFVNSYYWGEAVFGGGLESKGDTIRGIYEGHFIADRKLDNAKIKVTLVHPKLGTLNWGPSGTVSTLSSSMHQIAEVKYNPNLVVGRVAPEAGYKLFLHEGTRLEVTGKEGPWLKAKLSPDESIYIPENSVNFISGGSIPHSSIQIIRTKDSERSASVEFGFSERVPFSITEYTDPQRLEVTFYNVTSEIDWVFYDKKSDFIREIKHSVPQDGVLKVEIFLNEKTFWGYKPVYDGSILKLEVNKPAKKNSAFLFWNNQLKGRVISIDPGHTPEYGAVGPRGTKEKDVNYEISLKLKELLENKGAVVYLTHKQGESLPLTQRKARVNSFNPEVSISMHNNAVPQGVDPLVNNGSSVYYYYRQALPLAELIHRNLIKNLKLRDFGLYWDNLYMSRIPESISLLMEPAFMIVPEQERLLKTDEFQYKIAQSVLDALDSFYKEYSE
ncbi:MAG TPA: N-acetylmuramoyl-L-alanine amidase [Ignavibacteriales bacterium]|nr:N-acetylmuramoyl-L-alanine amidase [Ignavibacteriales bacterium]